MYDVYIVKPIGVGKKREGANSLIGPQVLGPIKVNSLPPYQPPPKKKRVSILTKFDRMRTLEHLLNFCSA